MTHPKELVSALRDRITEVHKKGDAVFAEVQKLQRNLALKQEELELLRKEFAELQALHTRYATATGDGITNPPLPSGPPAGTRIGPTDFLLSFVRKAPGQVVSRALLTEELSTAIRSGTIETRTTDAKKLASSLVGNLVKRGRLDAAVEGDTVTLGLGESR